MSNELDNATATDTTNSVPATENNEPETATQAEATPTSGKLTDDAKAMLQATTPSLGLWFSASAERWRQAEAVTGTAAVHSKGNWGEYATILHVPSVDNFLLLLEGDKDYTIDYRKREKQCNQEGVVALIDKYWHDCTTEEKLLRLALDAYNQVHREYTTRAISRKAEPSEGEATTRARATISAEIASQFAGNGALMGVIRAQLESNDPAERAQAEMLLKSLKITI